MRAGNRVRRVRFEWRQAGLAESDAEPWPQPSDGAPVASTSGCWRQGRRFAVAASQFLRPCFRAARRLGSVSAHKQSRTLLSYSQMRATAQEDLWCDFKHIAVRGKSREAEASSGAAISAGRRRPAFPKQSHARPARDCRLPVWAGPPPDNPLRTGSRPWDCSTAYDRPWKPLADGCRE